jgi:hypothetical protein
MKFGIDVSNYDTLTADGTRKPMNWDISWLDLAIIKSSEGLYSDPSFDMQWAAARGLSRVAYHFFRSNINAISQANALKLKLILGEFQPHKDYVAVDFETPDGMNGAQCLANLGSFLYEIEKFIPTSRILIYTYPGFWNGIGGAKATWAAKYPLWLAQWPRDSWILNFPVNIFDGPGLAKLKSDVETGVLKPMALKPWTAPAIWQFTARADTRAIPGYVSVKKVCDYNAVYLDVAQPDQYKTCPTCGGSGKVPA